MHRPKSGPGLAAIGLYGVVAYNVAARTCELGLRLALGAEPADLRSLVMKQVMGMAAIGVAIGLVVEIGLGRAAEALLFGLSALNRANVRSNLRARCRVFPENALWIQLVDATPSYNRIEPPASARLLAG